MSIVSSPDVQFLFVRMSELHGSLLCLLVMMLRVFFQNLSLTVALSSTSVYFQTVSWQTILESGSGSTFERDVNLCDCFFNLGKIMITF